MKRSEINGALLWAKALLTKSNIRLPLYAYWTLEDWKAHKAGLSTVRKVMLGWDITDFGMGDFSKVGAVLYTVRNGNLEDAALGVPYCEKYILMKDGQRLPKHYHVMKTEDIINRTGSVLQVFLWGVEPSTGKVLDTPVSIYQDGIEYTYQPGEEILIQPGNSISLAPYIAHIFGPKAGSGDLVVGEVSAINDDMADNFFLENTSRFADIEEDEAPVHPLCNEYDKLV
jgi:D-lyxose ketol-isomerase